jgi:dimeric dUTPase (all-alpha-NTP-PPase superfamily)
MPLSFTDYLEHQKRLNSYCDRAPAPDELQWAIIAELGEFANSRKGYWAWWKRNDKVIKSGDRSEQLTEAADVMCFLLTGVAMGNESMGNEFFEYCFNEKLKPNDLGLSTLVLFQLVFKSIEQLKYADAFYRFLQLLICVGYTREEIDGAYLAKVEVNLQRWAIAG